MNSTDNFSTYFQELQKSDSNKLLHEFRADAYRDFQHFGLPNAKHEEWKYTRIGSLFNGAYVLPVLSTALKPADLTAARLPGFEEANELFFINGRFSSELSIIHSPELIIVPLEDAATNEYKSIVKEHLGHSASYLKDGIHALNAAFVHGGVFIHLKKGKTCKHPVYIYNITDARTDNILSQPRSLVHISERAEIQIIECYTTLGKAESFTNQVMEIAVEQDARLEYTKIQNDVAHANQVSTTHIRQVGKSYTHAVTITLSGNIIRNNMNVVMGAANSEAHLHGLYFSKGKTHIDNHTVVDNVAPGCFSNELYKGIVDEQSSGVFNGKIFVRQPAQKTNAFQSNKNILLNDSASVNTKPQLEIFADDVKCSHGCTIGQLDEEGMFYLRSRGIPERIARSLLVQSFAGDIISEIKLDVIRKYVEKLVSSQLKAVE